MKTQTEVCGKRIQTCRLEKNETQEQIGELVGVNKSTVMRWEKGETKRINIDTIQILAEHYGVSPIWLSGYDVDRFFQPSSAYLLSKEEKYIIDAYRDADAEDRHEIFGVAKEVRYGIEKKNTSTVDGSEAC